MDEDISGFTRPALRYGEADLSTFTLIHTSEEGFFELYRGERSGQFRAYKCLKPQWRGSALHEAMLKKEFEIGYPLRHPNICEIFQYTAIGQFGNCIEMEWIDGEPLGDFLSHVKPGKKECRRLALELCDALSYMHSRQLVHRDLKPSNIMVTHSGHTVKLIDFGLADGSSHAILKSPAGTRKYMAPEVLAGGAADERSDIWSLGMVLSMMGGSYGAVVRKCLQNDPAKRYPNARSVREALSRKPLWPVPVAALLAISTALILMRRESTPPEIPERPAPDTVVVIMQPPMDSVAPPKASPRKPSDSGENKENELDRIFRQASDLFEEKL